MGTRPSEWPYLSMNGLARLPTLRQTTGTECGLACVAMVASYLGVGTDLITLRRKYPASMKGVTLKSLIAICESLRLSTRAVRCSVSELRQLNVPCVLHWGFNHFVVLKSAGREHIVIHDPARGVVKDSYRLAENEFTGIALEISHGRGFSKARRPPRLKLSALLPMDFAFIRKLSAGLVLALICELLVLASPFYLQIVIDQVLGKGDALLLNTLAVGFTALLLFQVAANTMRALTFQYLSQVSVFDVTARVLNRMLSLPLSYFKARDLGDVQHRVQSLRRVQNFIVHSAPALLLDVLFVVLIVALMSLYEHRLALLSLAVAAAWCLWRAILFPLGLRLSNEIALAESDVETHFLETLRAYQTVKLANGESARLSEWRNLFATGINQKIKAGNLAILDNVIRQLLFQGLRIGCIYVLAREALAGQMSVGMVSAFVAYLGMFIARAGGIVDRVIEYKLLEVPLNRLADIVFSEEESMRPRAAESSKASPAVEINNVAYSYAVHDPWILRDCNCSVRENGFTAITGYSGSGKTTLLRLVAGLDAVSSGKILVGGIAVQDWNARSLRELTATVFQEDCLLKGSIAENIALYDGEFDLARVRRAAQRAFIAGEIEAMPMSYETRIGDLGCSLSKGQSQRVLLARAFYRRPRLLLLDEATSGLDSELERKVIRSIAEFEATRIVITHSDRMLEAADEVLWLHKGTLLSSRPELNV